MGIEAAVVEPGTVTLAGGPGCGKPVTDRINQDMLTAAEHINHETHYAHLVAKPNPDTSERSYTLKIYKKKDLDQLRAELGPHLRRYDRKRGARKRIKTFAKDLVSKADVTNVIVLGLGSVSLADSDPNGAYDRLAWLLTFGHVLRRYVTHHYVKLLAQDHTFSPPEQFFLWTLGVHVVRDPDAFDLVNEHSMVVAFGDGSGDHGSCWSRIATRVWPAAILAEREGVEASTGRPEERFGDEEDRREGEVVERAQDFFGAYDRLPPPVGLEAWGDLVLLLRKEESPKKALEGIGEDQAVMAVERREDRRLTRPSQNFQTVRWESLPL